MITKTTLDVSTIPRVDIDFMNNTHAEEVEMVITLSNIITVYMKSDSKTDDQKQGITQALESWLQHTKLHFEKENELMREVQFPAYLMHAGEHESTLQKMISIVNEWKSTKSIEPVADFVFTAWPSWFESHINSMDTMTAKFAVMNGYDPQSQPDNSTDE